MNKKIFRKSFTKKEKFSFNIPNLLKIQNKSYDSFLQKEELPLERKNIGLQSVFNSFFPIFSANGNISLGFLSYRLKEPRYNVDECKKRGLSFSSVLKVTFVLTINNKKYLKKKNKKKNIKDNIKKNIKKVIKQEIFMGEIPLMTNVGTFIINGTERTVVSQLYKSPGVFFERDKNKNFLEKKLYFARIIPYKGSWLDFEFDMKDILYFRIDRSVKIPITVLLKAMNMTSKEILSSFFLFDEVYIKGNFAKINFSIYYLIGKKLEYDLYTEDGKLLLKKNNLITLENLRYKNKSDFCVFLIDKRYLIGFILSENILSNSDKKELLAFSNEKITLDLLFLFEKEKIEFFKINCISNIKYHNYISKILKIDKISNSSLAKLFIYKSIRFNELATQEIANIFFENLFFNKERYNLSLVGRLKLNRRLGFEDNYGDFTLSKKDIIYIIKILIDLKNDIGKVDDIDHLGNRRVRSVGELVENQLRFGLIKYEKSIKDRLTYLKKDELVPFDFIDIKIISNILHEFFCTSQLSQFLDQTNPLSEITHKRRISSLGPGGLTRERAGFEVRDVHHTHYGRICPIETPEGPNIGLINSLALYAYLNKHGFLVTPYYKVVNGKIIFKVKYLSASDEMSYFIAQANSNIDKNGNFLDPLVSARNFGENVFVSPKNIDFVDVSPAQLVSVAASLIPFLEHDDANRALMGANMQRQAVPCIKPESPLIGTGIESIVILNSGSIIKSLRGGKVVYVDSNKIIIEVNNSEITSNNKNKLDIYDLLKYKRTNQDTIINQRSIVNVDDFVVKNDIIADCSSSDKGELSLGQNILVAYMSWNGYNFEDSIIISERIVSDDRYTSIHIEELTVVARETKLGVEEITKDVINLSEDQLLRLDDSGIINIGAQVIPGDVLVGKITPKGEIQLTPEEKLLCAIFGEKSTDVKDTSLRVPLQMYGIVVDIEIFTKKGIVKDKRSLKIMKNKLKIYKLKLKEKLFFLENIYLKKLKKYLVGKQVISAYNLKKNDIITKKYLCNLKKYYLFRIILKDKKIQEFLNYIKDKIFAKKNILKNKYLKKIKKLSKNDELPDGVNKMVKVYIAVKKKLQPGDKMSGRHGNKGVVSRIVPVEDMPYMADGTVVDIILNPLGIPSRMNVGQVLEVHLGLASKILGLRLKEMIDSKISFLEIRKFLNKIYNFSGKKENFDNFTDEEIINLAKNLTNGIPFSTPVFDGASEKDISYLLNLAFPDNISKKLKMNDKKNQVILYDGMTGEPFEQFITIGYIYFLKLNHLVVDKIHARSTGPYSLITQQPLGGKSQFGGQRFGEMEVWALEAYGAAFILQEMLTVKSDDIKGRAKIYESLIKGSQEMDAGIPESFNVLIKEIKSLCIDIDLKYK